MTTRDSSMIAIAELRTLRLARLQEQARTTATPSQRAQRAQLESQGPAIPAEPAVESSEAARPPRASRTTLDRITALRVELTQLAGERAESLRERASRIDHLQRQLLERRSHWVPAATAVMVAALVLGALIARPEAAPLASAGIPEAPEDFEQALRAPEPSAVEPDAAAPAEVALLEQAEIPLLGGDAGMPEPVPEALPSPAQVQPRPRKVTAPKKPSQKRAPSARPAPDEADVLGNLDDCGDDPICGL